MRPTRVAGLVMIWLLSTATWALAQSRSDERALRNSPGSRGDRLITVTRGGEELSASSSKIKEWKIEGKGLTDEEAKEDAYRSARDRLAAFMVDQGSPTGWYPRVQDIDKLKPELKKGSEDIDVSGVGKVKQVTLVLSMKPAQFRQFQHDASQLLATKRMQGLGKGMGLFLGLLTALAGYFRLEEATKGYYTAWLRMAALGFVAAVAAGVWFLA
jgi:hypothetical protein